MDELVKKLAEHTPMSFQEIEQIFQPDISSMRTDGMDDDHIFEVIHNRVTDAYKGSFAMAAFELRKAWRELYHAFVNSFPFTNWSARRRRTKRNGDQLE